MFCPQCRHSNDASAKYCAGCGAELPDASQSVNTVSDPEEFYKAIIGPKNQGYYLRQFSNFDSNGKTGASWNWPALFLTFYWFLYRKMWVPAVIYFVLPYIVMILLGIAAAVAGKAAVTVIIAGYCLFGIAAFFFPALYGNALYYNHCKKKIAEAKASSSDIQRQLGELTGRGGTSYVVLIFVFILVFVAFVGILAAIAIPQYQDYTTRARMTQATIESNRAAMYVSEFYAQHGKVPDSLDQAGFNDPLPAFVSGMTISRNGVITTVMNTAPIVGKSFLLSPALDTDGKIVWTCSSQEIVSRYLPKECR